MKKIFATIFILNLLLVNTTFALPNPPMGSGTNPSPAGSGTNSPASTPAGSIPTLQNPLKANSVEELLYTIVDTLIFIGVIIATLMFVFIGFKFVMAQGNPKEIEEARKWFYAAVVGTAILICSKVIVEVIKSTLSSAGVVDESLFNKPK